MLDELTEAPRLTRETHPENLGTSSAPASPPAEFPRAGFFKLLGGMWMAGCVGCLLTLGTVALPLGAGDLVAAASMLPLALMLIAVVNGWIAANLYFGSGADR